jgi:heme-degrading monooxygenase HmoA
MFSVLFEVHPKSEQWDSYLGFAKMLKPELEQVDGFVDNIRYRSLTRDGWILSLSSWRDEKAVVRWRTAAMHHGVQEKGRDEVFLDYKLRVGQVTKDNQIPDGYALHEQRLDETEVGEGTSVTLINATRPEDWVKENTPEKCADWLGLDPNAKGLKSWDIYDAVLTPGDIILMAAWKSKDDALLFEKKLQLKESLRLREVRVIRDYGMFDRREAPQYYPEAVKANAD